MSAPVPRISIEGVLRNFRDTDASASKHAATDRRLSKAHLGIHAAGVKEAVAYFHAESDAPISLIVENQRGRATPWPAGTGAIGRRLPTRAPKVPS